MQDLNKPNQYGVPLHACNGYRMDEHYWKRLEYLRLKLSVCPSEKVPS
ncbi:hypothetical protein FDI24_gp039 [Acidovorax phage ACP17]|uniref:Uncharacterized protein n=1 Tax=Acidovorax phage ACP17 TaxID=2010329 RepID=A0A223AIY0_9CAUD|nr:hypothetical protein FDI24_gp039 [Acidovorax phage ACP17]ASS33916.1 hypothetical protein [Acidovorax phage ACP17]